MKNLFVTVHNDGPARYATTATRTVLNTGTIPARTRNIVLAAMDRGYINTLTGAAAGLYAELMRGKAIVCFRDTRRGYNADKLNHFWVDIPRGTQFFTERHVSTFKDELDALVKMGSVAGKASAYGGWISYAGRYYSYRGSFAKEFGPQQIFSLLGTYLPMDLYLPDQRIAGLFEDGKQIASDNGGDWYEWKRGNDNG